MKTTVLMLFASMVFFTSCSVIVPGIKGDGNVVSQERTASGFTGVTVSGLANVNVEPGGDYKVVVTTDSNLQSYVSAEVKDNVLYINTKHGANYQPANLKATKLIVDVRLPNLQSINLGGVGSVKLSKGSAPALDISLSGVGNIDAQDYQVQNVNIKASGVGDATVWATDSLNGNLSGVGNIRYKGSPAINVATSGVGSVKKM